MASRCIGKHDAEEENANGAALRAFAEQFQLSLVNTFWAAGPTWTSTGGIRFRIDYVLSDAVRRAERCGVADDVDLTFNAFADHQAVYVVERIQPGDAATATRHSAPFRVNKSALGDPDCCEAFRQMMWAFERPADAGVDEWLAELGTHVKKAAIAAFGYPRDSPQKPWISAATWSILRLIAPARREMCVPTGKSMR